MYSGGTVFPHFLRGKAEEALAYSRQKTTEHKQLPVRSGNCPFFVIITEIDMRLFPGLRRTRNRIKQAPKFGIFHEKLF